MKSLSLIKAALPLALACGPLLAQDVVEIHGYMRTGIGRSSNGGEQVTFYLPNTGDAVTAGPGYRLGNETDTYIELAVDVKAYEKGSTTFKLHFRPTFRQYYGARDASSDAGGNVNGSFYPNNTQQVFIREGWGEATGIFGKSGPFKDASLWIGRRFYQRQDLHIRDQWYWNNSGDGVGIENIDLGFGKLHYAFIQNDTGNVDTGWGAGHFPGNLQTDTYNRQGTVIGAHDLRLSDLNPWQGASVTLGIQHQDARSRATVENASNNNKGNKYSLMYTQSGVLGGDNRVYVAFGDGSTWYNWYNPELTTANKWHQIMDIFFIKPLPNLEMQGVVEYRRQDGADTNKGASNTWKSIGVRPTYFFTQHFSLAYEIGYDQLKFDNENGNRHLNKQTLALQWSPQASFWSRPQLRLFVTKGSWNNELANNWGPVDAGQFSSRGQSSGYTYGAQIEAWW
ncbi:maltoporin [Geothrix paludis]|uniref:maltoporin n=1 Tax=Geothrix paludis TaxID=2922722 RepID=UPI001FADF26C|nr:carbohydrate porin [Geothrix paludis]